MNNIKDFWEFVLIVKEQAKNNRLPLIIFLGLCFNLLFAPLIYAATGVETTRKEAYALGVLGCVTFGLSVYLFFVIFQPEKF
jgi:K+-transporting ATPase KdpF subunit